MSIIIHLLLMLCTAGTQVSAEITSHVLLQESLFKEFGRFLERAVDRLNGDSAPADVAVPAMQAQVDAGPAPTERERKEYRDRIQGHAAVVQAWVADRCQLTAEQQELLAKRAAELTEDPEFQPARQDNRRQTEAVPKVMPVLFAGNGGPAGKLADDLLEFARGNILTEDQKARLESALEERQASQQAAWVDYLTALLDDELYLSSDQQNRIREDLASRPPGQLHPLYSFQPQTYFVPYEPVHTLLTPGIQREVLDRRQRDRLRDIENAVNGSQNLTFMSNTGPDEWGRQVREASQSGQTILLRAAEVRIAWLQREYGLSDQQCERLRVAGKGATVRVIDDWKESTQMTIEQMQQQMAQFRGNFGFGVAALDINGLDQSDIWIQTLSEVARGSGQEKLPDRDQLVRTATAASVTALLDQELWLLPEQREALRPVVLDSLPRNRNVVRQQEYIREMILIAYPLFKSKPERREAVLSEVQRTAWAAMQSLFQFQQNNNYVQIQLRNQGGTFGFVLQE